MTDRCNIRCVYCMPETVEFLPRQSVLSFEEIERFVRVATTLGIEKVRLTGGESLVRRELPKLVAKLAAIPGVKDLGLTTNGILLAPMARALWDAGLRRINVSLDTMDPAKFQELTRRTGFEQVIEGILAARAAGFDPVKVNAVAIKGVTEDDVVPLGRFAREHGLELRFIEYMPLDADNHWILLANLHQQSIGRSLGKMGAFVKGKLRLQTTKGEFANSIPTGSGTRSSSRPRSSTGSCTGSVRWPPRSTRTRGPRPSITTTSTAAGESA